MTDAVMSVTDREEALSRAYVSAIAAGAGYTTAVMNLDRDGVDVQVRAGGSMRPSLDIQLKATVNLGESVNGAFRFPLRQRNYGLLREQTMVPRILVLLDLPKDEADWLRVTPEELVLKRCAYWASLVGFPETDNKETVTISIQAGNRFNVEGLRALMERARTGAIA
jgi:hypothetical protein